MPRFAQIALFAGVALAAPQAQIEARWGGGGGTWGGWNGWKQSTTTTTAALSTSTDLATSTPVVVVSVTSATPTVATSTSVAVASSTPVVTSTPAPTSTVAATATTGKRGVAYNTASYAAMFTSSPEVSWAYNWASSSSGLTSSLQFVPMLWGTGSGFTSVWSANAQAAINAGSEYLMSFNEPDHPSQANLSPADAAAAFKTYMQPFAGKAQIGAPAITNGGGDMGLTWLSSFMGACSDCSISFINLHWYSNYAPDFIAHVEAAYAQFGKPIWVTEFALTDSTDAEVEAFMETVTTWMDSTDYVHHYSYFMASQGSLINSAGTGLSAIGSAFAS